MIRRRRIWQAFMTGMMSFRRVETGGRLHSMVNPVISEQGQRECSGEAAAIASVRFDVLSIVIHDVKCVDVIVK